MKSAFAGRNSGQVMAQFTLIAFKRVSKLASAASTDFVQGGKGQISRGVVFAGTCQQRVAADSPLFDLLRSPEVQYQVQGQLTAEKVVATLINVKASIMQRLRTEGVIKFGTTKFYTVDETSTGVNYGEACTETPTLTNKYFYSQETV